jgi:GDPmannose 4,6-dehydratase
MKAFITGVNGMDGSYLSDFLIDKGYEVHGTVRRSSVFTTKRIEHLRTNPNFHLHFADLSDSSCLHRLLSDIKPDEIYNLGAESHVAVSFDTPEYCADINGVGTLRLLDAMKCAVPEARFYQASTSEMFGGYKETAPQNENTPFHPRSPYGASKLYAYWIAVNYREAHNLFISNGILFNHEGPRRGNTFVTKKITTSVARITRYQQEKIKLGNLDAVRDWGSAKEYVQAMWLMLQHSAPDDFVIATGKAFTVRQWVEWTFDAVGITIKWDGKNEFEIGYDDSTGEELVCIDPKYYRPSEVDYLLGDATKAKDILHWQANKSAWNVCRDMIAYDLEYDDYGGKEW